MLISERKEFWIIFEVINYLCSSSSPVVGSLGRGHWWEQLVGGKFCTAGYLYSGLQFLVPTNPPGFENLSWHFALSSTLFFSVTTKLNALLGVI